MGLRNNIEVRNEQEVIRILQDHGIHVIMKPMALLPDNLESCDGIGIPSVGIIEMDIYKALEKLERRKRIIPDPFS